MKRTAPTAARASAIFLLALLVAGCRPTRKNSAATAAKDRRVTFAGVSILIPAGVKWEKSPSDKTTTATWGSTEEPWCDIMQLSGYGESAKGRRFEIERHWKDYLPRLQRANPEVKIPPASWSNLGSNPYFSTRFRTTKGAQMQGGYLLVGDRVIMLVLLSPRPGTPSDPAALPALKRLAESISPIESRPIFQ